VDRLPINGRSERLLGVETVGRNDLTCLLTSVTLRLAYLGGYNSSLRGYPRKRTWVVCIYYALGTVSLSSGETGASVGQCGITCTDYLADPFRNPAHRERWSQFLARRNDAKTPLSPLVVEAIRSRLSMREKEKIRET